MIVNLVHLFFQQLALFVLTNNDLWQLVLSTFHKVQPPLRILCTVGAHSRALALLCVLSRPITQFISQRFTCTSAPYIFTLYNKVFCFTTSQFSGNTYCQCDI